MRNDAQRGKLHGRKGGERGQNRRGQGKAALERERPPERNNDDSDSDDSDSSSSSDESAESAQQHPTKVDKDEPAVTAERAALRRARM